MPFWSPSVLEVLQHERCRPAVPLLGREESQVEVFALGPCVVAEGVFDGFREGLTV